MTEVKGSWHIHLNFQVYFGVPEMCTGRFPSVSVILGNQKKRIEIWSYLPAEISE